MRIRVLIAGTLAVALAIALGAQSTAIRPDAILDHVKFLASDDMRGRASGSPELERAADYIAERFRAAGLEPGGDGGTWFQRFELDAGLTVGAGNTLSVQQGSRAVTLKLGTSYYPMAAVATDTPERPSVDLHDVPLVFAGYGITAIGLGYDDYADVDVTGKAAIVFSHEPQEQVRLSRFNGNQPIPESSLFAKARAARNRGAVALLIVSDPVHDVDQANYEGFSTVPEADDLGIPVLRVRRTELTPLVTAWNLDGLARAMDGDLRPRSRALTGATISYAEFLTRNRKTVRNVVGILRGRGSSAHESIVVGAHYDHVGLGGRYSVTPERTGEVHNGADDNASGTAALIEIAGAAAATPTRFPRSMVFVAFSGEELGLLGSRHYTQHPAMPLADTVAMLNLDMVGRLRGAVDVSGFESAPSLLDDLEAASRSAGNLAFQQEGPGAGRSDDFPFVEAGVPAINFFTGFHRDYHRPSDDWQAVNAYGTARIARLAIELAARIAARPDRPAFTPPRR